MASRPTSPAEPTKKYPPPIQPNAHPYAIKTTSSALLSRNNSSPHSAHPTRHNYVPLSHSRIPTGAGARHRHSSSSSVEGEMCNANTVRTIPTPLPTPPSVGKTDTMLSSATRPLTENHSYDQKYIFSHEQDPRPEPYAGLPANPKQWNTDELVSYLETSFNLGNTANGGEEDSSLANVLECVRARGLTGCELLQLTDADLAGTTLSDTQRTLLLAHSRILRAGVLRGRIYVDSYHSHEVSDDSSIIYSESAHCSTSLRNLRGISVSTDDSRLFLDNNTGEAESSFFPSAAMSLHRSNSVSAQRYRDLARMRMRRRGRVKGLVETWERASTSGSESSTSEESSVSGSEAGPESEIDQEFESISDGKHSLESPPDLPSALHDEPHRDVRSSSVDPALVAQDPPLSTPPPPYTHMHPTCGVVGDLEEEPSIEELLASPSSVSLKGARAWEADFGLGETIKRIPVPLGADAGNPSSLVVEPDISRRPQDGGQQTKGDTVRSRGSGTRRSTGSGRKNVNTRKRVVTAIFTGSCSDNASEDADDEMHSGVPRHHATGIPDVILGEVLASLDPQNDPDRTIRTLGESIAATRSQLEAFKLRLKEVEADTARQQAILIQAQSSDALYSSNFELRQRRSEASERATLEARRVGALEDMPLTDIARVVATKAMGWLFPYGRLGVQVEESRTRTDSRPGANDRRRTLAKRVGRSPVVRMSCSIILVSIAICAAVLRRMGFGQWVRRP